jgi:hypothetical protein
VCERALCRLTSCVVAGKFNVLVAMQNQTTDYTVQHVYRGYLGDDVIVSVTRCCDVVCLC